MTTTPSEITSLQKSICLELNRKNKTKLDEIVPVPAFMKALDIIGDIKVKDSSYTDEERARNNE